jgi:hypothetical protein
MRTSTIRATAAGAAIVGIAGGALAACGGTSSSPTTQQRSATQSSSASGPVKRQPAVLSREGQTISFTYMDEQTTARLSWKLIQKKVVNHRVYLDSPGEYSTPDPGQQYLGLTVGIHNRGPGTLDDAALSGNWNWAGTGARAGQVGGQVEIVISVTQREMGLRTTVDGIPTTDLMGAVSLPPGKTVVGTIVFQVPKGAGSIQLISPQDNSSALATITY